MKTHIFLKTLMMTVTFVMAFYPKVWADDCEEGYVRGFYTGNCIPASGGCGTNCNYTVDSQGNAKIYGTGEIRAYFDNEDFVNVTIEDGITGAGYAVFDNGYISLRGHPIQSISLPESFTMMNSRFNGRGDYYGGRLASIILPENIQLPNTYGIGNSVSSAIKVYCSANNVDCAKIEDSRRYEYIKDGDNYVIYHNGEIVEIFGSKDDFKNNIFLEGSYTKKDENGKPIAQYDGRGNVLASYTYNSDGSVSTYDKNGKLIAIQGKRIYTIDEATALVSKNGKNTFSIRYR